MYAGLPALGKHLFPEEVAGGNSDSPPNGVIYTESSGTTGPPPSISALQAGSPFQEKVL
jgi:hypothetical protein